MKQIFIVFLALSTSFAAMSRTLTPEEALARVQMSRSDIRFAPSQYKNTKLIYTKEIASTDIPAVYIFNNGDNGGYMVLSANDAVTPMLGYSESGNIDPENLPDNFRWWIEEYARQIEWAEQQPALASDGSMSRAGDFASIEPLCKTTWNQSYPYNISAPSVNGKQCLTGCVATAMAQVMKYHNWPAKGFGEHSYDWNGKQLSMNFENVAFEWNKMYASHTASTTSAAVAKLMYACGISVDMDYGTNASSSASSSVPTALYKYFRYDCSHVFYKDEYSDQEWNQMLWDNLKNYGPIVYSGSNPSGSHAFVCDGYSSNGYFHFNWGWGGTADGYFKTTALTPNGSSYNSGQRAILGISPDEGNCHFEDVIPMSKTRVGEPFEIQIKAYNPHDFPADTEVFLIFVNMLDTKEIVGYGTPINVHLEKGQKDAVMNVTSEFAVTPPVGDIYWVSLGTFVNNKIVDLLPSYHYGMYMEEMRDQIVDILDITNGDALGEINVRYRLKMQNGNFNDALRLVYTDANSRTWQIRMNQITCEQGQTVESVYTYKLPNPVIGHTYYFNLNINGGSPLLDSPFAFTLPDPASISDLDVDEDAEAEYYDLQGRKIETENMRPGVYIKRIATDSGIKTEKIIVK